MLRHAHARQGRRATAPVAALEVADIFRAHGDAYRQAHRPSHAQRSVMRAIESCRTAALGGHLDVCDSCGFERPAFNSCRNRHCPKCQCLAQARWIDQRMERIVPTRYFHLVFTLPASLRPLALHNRRLLFTILFQAASHTLLTLGGDPKRLGGRLGITSVLHTWTRTLLFHPHLHCLVTGGALSTDGQRWVATRSPNYLFPVRVLSALFRAKFLHALRSAFRSGKISFASDIAALAEPQAFGRLIDTLYRQPWVVYAKRPFGGPEHVFRYLGRYTHRVAISNQRLKGLDRDGVRFLTRGANTVTVHPVEFIRRFLLHVLPPGFVKIRHYGLFAPAHIDTALVRARELLADHSTRDPVQHQVVTAAPAQSGWRAQLLDLTGVDPLRCSRCERGKMIRSAIPRALPRPDG